MNLLIAHLPLGEHVPKFCHSVWTAELHSKCPRGNIGCEKDKYSIIEDGTTLNLYVGGSIEKSRADHDMSSARMVCIAEERISMK